MAGLDAQRVRQPVTATAGRSGGIPPSAPTGSSVGGGFGVEPTSTTLSPRPPRQSVSAGSVLLALGAGCLVVAAFVFVAVTWGSMSLATRTLVLLGLTALAFSVAGWLTTRRLHGSVEALSAVSWTFLAIDLAGARSSGLFGLDGLELPQLVLVAGLVAAVPASLAVWATRHAVGREPVVSSLVAFTGWLLSLAGISLDWSGRLEWLLVALVVLTAAVTLVYAGLALRRLAAGMAAVTAGLHLALLVLVAELSVSSGHERLVADGDVWPVLAAIGLTVLAAETLRRLPATRSRAVGIVVVAAIVVTALASLLVVVPTWYSGAGAGTAALCLVALLLTALGRFSAASWLSGARMLAPLALLACAVVSLPWILSAGIGIGSLLELPWESGADAHIDIPDAGPLLPLWTAVPCLLTQAVGFVLISRWQRPPLSLRLALSAAAASVWAAVSVVLVVQSALLAVAVLAFALPGVLLIGAGAWSRSDAVTAAGGAALLVACALASPSVGLSLTVWAGTLAVCVAVVLRDLRSEAAAVGAGAAVALAVGCTAAAVGLAGGEQRSMSLALSVVVAVIVAGTAVLPAVPVRAAILLTALSFGSLAVALAADIGPAPTGLALTLIGAAAALVGVVDRTRWPVAVLGTCLLIAAWWLRLVASDIDVVEAYTGLPCVIVLAAGLWMVLRRGSGTLQALLPGLVLLLAPSLPWSTADPTSTRGVLVSAAALVLLATGTHLRWAAPFLVGAAVVALMTLVHLAPFADAAPRWVVLGLVGLTMLCVGITWEARVRDLRTVAVFVRAMR
jgi:hypothetical protein